LRLINPHLAASEAERRRKVSGARKIAVGELNEGAIPLPTGVDVSLILAGLSGIAFIDHF
jgi:hypothetical protein